MIARAPEPTRFTFELLCFRGSRDLEESVNALAFMLDALTARNEDFLRRNPRTPLLYTLARQGRVRYQSEPLGADFWRDVPTVLHYGVADCEDLAAWLTAEKRVRLGLPARTVIVPLPRQDEDQFDYHIIVETPDGSRMGPSGVRFEDPSRVLGMPG